MSTSPTARRSRPSGVMKTDSATDVNGTNIKDTVIDSEVNASAAVNAVQNHPVTQNVVNGPVATSVKNEAAATANEFDGLANSRAPPSYTAANNTELTNYHSFFYTLLSWKHPRATAISFVGTLLFIFACRYMPVIRYMLKMTYLVLGVVTLAELAAKLVAGASVATSVRPRRYYRIPKEKLEATLDDLEHLINFFVIEMQRIVFAENIPVTAATFLSAFISYYLIKILPAWGMALLSTCVVFLLPLVYVSNKELIDNQLEQAGNVINAQATQVKELTAQHAGKSFETVKAYTGDYAAKAGEMMGSARQKIPIPGAKPASPTIPDVKAAEFPTAPSTTIPSAGQHTKPIVATPIQDRPIAASTS